MSHPAIVNNTPVFIVDCVAAGLFLVAILFAAWNVFETKKTTNELKGVEEGIKESVATLKAVQDSIQHESEEVKETTNQIRETKDAIRQQSEAIFVSQLRFKWSSPEIRYSASKVQHWDFSQSGKLKGFLAMTKTGAEDLDKTLEIPRFFEDLVFYLVHHDCISLETAEKHFGIVARQYWRKFKPLILKLREEKADIDYHFDMFETLGTGSWDSLAHHLGLHEGLDS